MFLQRHLCHALQHNFDFRYLMKRIVTSQAYQRSSDPEPRNVRDDKYYSHFLVKRLTAEQRNGTKESINIVPSFTNPAATEN